MELIIKATSVAELKTQITELYQALSGGILVPRAGVQFMGAAGANLTTGETSVTTAVIHDIEPEEKPAKKTKAKKETVAEPTVESPPTVQAATVSEPTAEKAITFDTLREVLQKVATKKGLGEASKVLSKFKARTLKELPPAHYEKFQAACAESLG